MWGKTHFQLHRCHRLQLRVLATDGGSPSLSSTATVRIQVIRNLHQPRFEPISSSRWELPDKSPPGTLVGQVRATDDDREVCVM